MPIKTALFLKSCTVPREYPAADCSEFAFIGRSNVGKSSLINCLCGHARLALTSSKPGKTVCVNFFDINGAWRIVDLPGYGYARVGKELRDKIDTMIRTYILQRENLTNLFVLVDSRLPPQKIDLEFIHWLGEQGIPFSLVFTKTDKLSKTAVREHVEIYRKQLSESWEPLPPLFLTSAQTGEGKEDVVAYMEQYA